jgi:hypothetical protein
MFSLSSTYRLILVGIGRGVSIADVSDLVNRDISTAKGSRKPIRLDCL